MDLRHVKTGEQITAAGWNALIDELASLRERDALGGGVLPKPLTPSLEVLIRNDTGANLSAGSVLRVTNWLVTPVTYPFEVRGRPVLAGNTPNATTNLIVILSESIPNGQLGSAVIPGPVAVCDVLVNDAAHTYAQPISGDNTRLGSATAGIARIAAWETSGAVRRAIVVLGDGQAAGGSGVRGRADSSPAAPGTGPRPTINLKEASPAVGKNIDITLADDAGEDELEFTFDNLGVFGRAGGGADGSAGPRRRIDLSKTSPAMGSNLTITLSDDAGNDELDFNIRNLGVFARVGAGSNLGPRPRLDIDNATPTIGNNLDVAITDDGANDELDVRIDNLGMFGRAQGGSSGSAGPRRRFDLSHVPAAMGSNLTITATDDAANDEIDFAITNLGMFARPNSGVTVGPRPRFDFRDGSGIAITVIDDGANNEIDVSVSVNGAPVWVKVTKSYADFAAAASSNNITIYTLPSRGVLHWGVIKHNVAFGGGTITAYDVDMNDGVNSLINPSNVFQAPGNTLFNVFTAPNPQLYNFGATQAIKSVATCNIGSTLNEATAGSVDFYLLVSVLP